MTTSNFNHQSKEKKNQPRNPTFMYLAGLPVFRKQQINHFSKEPTAMRLETNMSKTQIWYTRHGFAHRITRPSHHKKGCITRPHRSHLQKFILCFTYIYDRSFADVSLDVHIGDQGLSSGTLLLSLIHIFFSAKVNHLAIILFENISGYDPLSRLVWA